MLTRMGQVKVGRTATHRKSLVINQLKSLFERGQVVTTTPKAKLLKSNADRLFNKKWSEMSEMAKNRTLMQLFNSQRVVKEVLRNLGGNLEGISIVKVGFRKGDNAEISKVRLIGYESKVSAKKGVSKNKAKKVEVSKGSANEIAEQNSKRNENFGSKITSSIKNRLVGGSKERTRARSGL